MELVGNNPLILNKYLTPFVVTFVIIGIAYCAILFALGKYLSHRIAGPIYAFEKFLDQSLEGTDRKLKLRAGDEFKHLESLGEKIRLRLKDMRDQGVLPGVPEDELPPAEPVTDTKSE